MPTAQTMTNSPDAIEPTGRGAWLEDQPWALEPRALDRLVRAAESCPPMEYTSGGPEANQFLYYTESEAGKPVSRLCSARHDYMPQPVPACFQAGMRT